jgi:hypothetical protein
MHRTAQLDHRNRTPLPDYPWQQVSTDPFVLNGNNFLVVADCFYRYPEVIPLSTISQAATNALKAAFANPRESQEQQRPTVLLKLCTLQTYR